ncbi:MAG: ATP-binding protein [Defluviitaleaceae bacterium]|nr:ATP-binding protein [Defluviitaleaceae bacterium]
MAQNRRNERDEDSPDIYYIPPNYTDSGGVFGGTFKVRNAIEAAIIVGLLGWLLLNVTTNLGIETRIIILLAVLMPIGFLALVGVIGLSISQFLMAFIRFIFKRKIIGHTAFQAVADAEAEEEKRWDGDNAVPPSSHLSRFIDRIKSRRGKTEGKSKTIELDPVKRNKSTLVRKGFGGRYIQTSNEAAEFLPIKKIKNGIIHTNDGRYVKIIEVTPINFLMRTPKEQRSIIWSFASFLKISPMRMQLKCLSKKADIDKLLNIAREDLIKETNNECRELQRDYMNLLYDIGSKEAVSRRFFIIFEYEPYFRAKNIEQDAKNQLENAANTARNYLDQCGNELIRYDDSDEFIIEALYQMLNRKSSFNVPLVTRKREVIMDYAVNYGKNAIENISPMKFCAPKYIDLSKINYIKMDGMYISYLVLTADGFKTHVTSGWISLLVNAGEGIDIDIYLGKEPKEKMSQSLGRHLRMNKSKIKNAQDTNDDFGDLVGSIDGGYYMKNGIANNEDFYYTNILITVTGTTKSILEYRIMEMEKKLKAQDMDVQRCSFRMEEALLSSLPLVRLNKDLQKWSRRNMLTSGAASCYPLTSFEMCDDNGILLGVNKHNRSLIMMDIFNSAVYKNANMAILGTSGAGKTFALQLMATRMRRKGTQVFILAPLKGHEFYRACNTIGGSFIQISPSSKHCINVMEIRPVDTAAAELIDGVILDNSLLATKVQQLHIFFSLLIPDMNYEERQLLDDSIIRTYDKFGMKHDNVTLIDPMTPEDPNFPGRPKFKKMPVLGDLHTVLSERDETKRMANIINRLVAGSASTFNQQTNVNLDNKYTVLDISELTGDLLTVGMFVALDYVWDKAKQDRTKEKAILIDETWRLIGESSNKLAANFVFEIFKIIRGYAGAAICATQDINDFFALDGGKYGKGIINNCKTKIILNLEDDEADRVQDILGLSDSERHAIVNFEQGHAMISANKNNVTVEIIPSPHEKELITTDRKELKVIADRKRAEIQHRQLMADVDAVSSKRNTG